MKEFASFDEVLDFAIKTEIEAAELYAMLADFVGNPETAEALEDMALEESRHKAKLEAVKAGEITIEKEEIGNLGIADRLEDIVPYAKMNHVDLLVLGMKKEEAARKLYTDLAAVAREPELRDIFLKLAREEAEHKLRFEFEYDLTVF